MLWPYCPGLAHPTKTLQTRQVLRQVDPTWRVTFGVPRLDQALLLQHIIKQRVKSNHTGRALFATLNPLFFLNKTCWASIKLVKLLV